MKPSTVPIERILDVVSAYVAHNRINPDELPSFIQSLYETIARLQAAEDRLAWVDDVVAGTPLRETAAAGAAELAATAPLPRRPAVPIAESVHHDHLICLEDGKSFKALKRHLKASHNLTPEDYRARWALPLDYPMVCEEYSGARSIVAKETGLGKGPKR